MTEPATIRPDGAWVLVVAPSEGAGSDADLVDRADAEGGPLVLGDAGVPFVAVAVGVGAPAPEGPVADRPGQVALVGSADAATDLRARGWAGPVVVEVVLDERARERLAVLRRAGELVGVVVPPGSPVATSSASSPSSAKGSPEVDLPVADDRAPSEVGRARGRAIGLLTDALLSGVATIRTHDPVTARRVRAVVAALTEPDQDAARMDP